jgi:P-type E1-E2 ATPase
VGWFAAGEAASFVIERVVTVLVIACPHALGLAIPLVVAISTTIGARNGLLVRDRRGLEEARNVTTVFFDKTGTLTRGEFLVVEMTTRAGLGQGEALALAAAVLSIPGVVVGPCERVIHSSRTSEAPRPDPRRVSEVSIPPNRSRSTF